MISQRRSLLLSLGLAAFIVAGGAALFLLVGGVPKGDAVAPPASFEEAVTRPRRADGRTPVNVIMLGDSLTVGGFGEALQSYLTSHYGRAGVVLVGSCGSSPENWLADEPVYLTKCGFRSQTPSGISYLDFVNGHHPPATPTPKLETLLGRYRPSAIIVQQGTNWMDPIVARGFDEERYRTIIHRFISAVRRSDPKVPIIWITPPDHSKYSARVKQEVNSLLHSSARSEGYEVIDSSRMTHYKPGETGGDGVHYRTKEAQEWAAKVETQLNARLPRG